MSAAAGNVRDPQLPTVGGQPTAAISPRASQTGSVPN